MGSKCLMGAEFQFCKMETVLEMDGLMVAQQCRYINAAEVVEMINLCDMYYLKFHTVGRLQKT
jgi:hypothetical protein